MPRKSNKGYDPINLDNLEKAIKLWEELNSMHKNASLYASKYMDYMAEIDSLVGKNRKGSHKQLADLKEELKYYKDIAQEQANIEMLKQRELQAKKQELEIAKEQDKITKQNVATMNKLKDYKKSQLNKDVGTLSWSNFGQFVTSNSKHFQDTYKKEYDRVYRNALNREKRAAKKEGRAIDFSNVTSGIESDLQKSDKVKKIGLAADVFQVAANTFKKAVDTVWSLFMKGSNNQLDTFEDTFEGISVRNRVTRGQYYSAQVDLNNKLSQYGVRNNIASSDVQKMWSTFATQGLQVDMSSKKAEAEITSRAIDTILTNRIVPYLDMSSSSAQLIADSNPTFMKQVRGIGLATQDINGSSVFIQKHLQDLVDDVAPMASLAEKELGVQFAQLSGAYENLRSQGLNDAQIGELYKNTATVYNNPYQALTRGSLDQQLAVVNGMTNNIDFKDISAVDQYTRAATNEISNWMPEGNLSSFWGGLLSSNGMVGVSGITSTILNEANASMKSATEAGNKVAELLDKASDDATNDYKNDINQTNRRKSEIWLENASNELTAIREQLGIWEPVISTLLSGIGTLFATWIGAKLISGVVGKGIGALAGSAVGGTGAGILATTGGIALGVIGGVLATKAIADAIVSADEEKRNRMNNSSVDKGYKNQEDSFNNPVVQSAIEQSKSMGNTGGFGDTLANGFKKGGLFGVGAAFGWGDSYSAKEKRAWNEGDWKNYNIYKPLSAGINDMGQGADASSRAALMIAYALALREVGYLKDGLMAEIFGSAVDIKTDEDLFMFMASASKNLGVGAREVANWASIIMDSFGGPFDSRGNQWDGTVSDQMGELYSEFLKDSSPEVIEAIQDFAQHRQGLDYVPYDGYKAELHQGEAVLTASTSSELRNLIDEYRKTAKQSVEFDSIIQSQTSALVNKMDEIIGVISNNGSMFPTSQTAEKAQSLLRNSMTRMISTRDFSQ